MKYAEISSKIMSKPSTTADISLITCLGVACNKNMRCKQAFISFDFIGIFEYLKKIT